MSSENHPDENLSTADEMEQRMRRIVNITVIAEKELQGRLIDEGHRKSIAALRLIGQTARGALSVLSHTEALNHE